jgi:hypothetical protein
MITETFTATGGQQDFPFVTPYLSESHLTVSVNDVETSAWSLTSAQVLRLDSPASLDDTVAISRSTPIADPLVTFASPSTLRSAEINLAILQLLYNLQEQDAEDLSALRSDIGVTKWLADNLPIKSLGAPVDGSDAARLSDITDAIVAGGNIPAFSIADAGRALGINNVGNVGWESPGGGVSTFRVVPQPVTGPEQGGYVLPASGNNLGEAVPVEKLADSRAWWSGTAPYVSGDYDLVLPSTGVYEVTVQARLRSIPQGNVVGQSSASLFLSDPMGSFAYDVVNYIRLGFDGPGAGIQDAYQGSAFVTLSAVITVPGTASLNLRGNKGGDAIVVIDTPSIITVKELR